MGAVLVYFWPQWKGLLAAGSRCAFLRQVCLATACTGGLGLTLKLVLEQLVLARLLGQAQAEVEQLFRHLPLMSAALLAVGILIIRASRQDVSPPGQPLTGRRAMLIGVVQACVCPFLGFPGREPRFRPSCCVASADGTPRSLASPWRGIDAAGGRAGTSAAMEGIRAGSH